MFFNICFPARSRKKIRYYFTNSRSKILLCLQKAKSLYSRSRERIRASLGFLLIGPRSQFSLCNARVYTVCTHACMHVCAAAFDAFVRIALIYTSERRTADTMR